MRSVPTAVHCIVGQSNSGGKGMPISARSEGSNRRNSERQFARYVRKRIRRHLTPLSRGIRVLGLWRDGFGKRNDCGRRREGWKAGSVGVKQAPKAAQAGTCQAHTHTPAADHHQLRSLEERTMQQGLISCLTDWQHAFCTAFLFLSIPVSHSQPFVMHSGGSLCHGNLNSEWSEPQ